MMERKRLSASERDSLVKLNIVLEILRKDLNPLRTRLGSIPYAKRDLAMMASVIQKLMEKTNETIPDEQIMTYINALKMSSYVIGAKSPGKNKESNMKDYGMWLPYEILNHLFNGCHDHCLMCTLGTVERRQCILRKTLDAIPNDVPDREDGDCPYGTVI